MSTAFWLLVGLATVLAYLCVAWFVLPPEAVWSPDTGAKLLQLQSLRLENGRLAYDLPYPGRALDPDLRFAQDDPFGGFLTIRDGRIFFQRLPILPSLTRPFFRLFGHYGLYLVPALAGAACALLSILLLPPARRRLSMWVFIALASPVFIYSTLFWEHTLAVALGLGATWLTFRTSRSIRTSLALRILGWLAAGLLLSAAAYIRLEMLIFAGALLVAHLLFNPKGRIGALGAGLVLVLAMLPYRPLHSLLFGGQEMPDNATYLFYPFSYLTGAQWRAIPELLVGPLSGNSIEPGWLAGLLALSAIVVVVHSLIDGDSPARRFVMYAGWAAIIVGTAALLFSPQPYHSVHGLILTTPWAIWAVARARKVWQQGGLRIRVLTTTCGLGLLGYTISILGFRSGAPHGGLEWGARFAMVYYALLALIAGWPLDSKRRDTKTLLLVASLLFLGIGFQLRGLGTIRHDKQLVMAMTRKLAEMPEQQVVTDFWWLPLASTSLYNQKQFFVVDSADDLAEWVEMADAARVQQFMLLTLDVHLVEATRPLLKDRDLASLESLRLEHVFLYRLVIQQP